MILTEKTLRNIISEAIQEIVGYHGTGANFSEFDDRHVSTGAGSQVFGWGTYIAGSKKIGNDYAKVTETPCLLFDGQIVYDDRQDITKNFSNPYRLIYDVMKCNGKLNKRELLARAKYAYNETKGDKKLEDFWSKVINLVSTTNPSQWKLKNRQTLLTVEIPDDDGHNYIHWHEIASEELKERIVNALYKYITTERNCQEYCEDGTEDAEITRRNMISRLRGYIYGKDIYEIAVRYVGDPEMASYFLNEIGFTGIIYKAGTVCGGAKKGDLNYVIFNPKDVQIVNRQETIKR